MRARLTCCVTFDFDAMSVWLGTYGRADPAALSRGEFGAYAMPRILALLRRRGVRATFFTPGHTALAYPHLVEQVLADGHEIGHHGWVHRALSQGDLDAERSDMERGLRALEHVGAGRPAGYRAPGSTVTTATTGLLLEHGFLYDSSRNATDFHPYYLRDGDVASFTEPFRFGALTTLVEAPYAWSLTDFAPFELVPGVLPGFTAPSAIEEMWRGEFDYAHATSPGGCFTVVLHPQVIGRGHRLVLLERLLDHFQSHADVGFEPLGEYVRRWRDANPLDRWAEANPTLAGTGAVERLP
jgi:peptidoglycan/xylan/chitin deacetylase (PgdA/CDA1 family)